MKYALVLLLAANVVACAEPKPAANLPSLSPEQCVQFIKDQTLAGTIGNYKSVQYHGAEYVIGADCQQKIDEANR